VPVLSAVKWKDKITDSCSHKGKFVHASLYDASQEFKQCLKTHCLESTSAPITTFLHLRPSYIVCIKYQDWRAIRKPRENVSMFRVQGTVYHRVGTLLPIASRTPSSAHLYVFDSDMEAGVNLRCRIMDGWDRQIVVTIQRVVNQVNSFVKIFLRAGDCTRNQEVLNGLLASHEALVVKLRKQSRPPCNELAAILLEDNMRAERDNCLHQ
jgi:hypothetical protein